MFHDVRHNFIFSSTYELPFGKGRKWGSDWSGVTNAVLGGWKLGGIFQARTGLPITVTDGRNRSLQGERGAERPNCVGDPEPADQSIDHWLDINAFQAAALGTFGNCPRRRRAGAGLLERRPRALEALRGRRRRATSSSGSRPSTPSTTRASGRRRATSRCRTRSA